MRAHMYSDENDVFVCMYLCIHTMNALDQGHKIRYMCKYIRVYMRALARSCVCMCLRTLAVSHQSAALVRNKMREAQWQHTVS